MRTVQPPPATTGLEVPLADGRLTIMGLLAETFTALAARELRQLAAHGLSPVEFEVVLRLARSPDGLLRMTDLAAQTSLTASGITRVVDRLVHRGLVTRQACPVDRRTTYAVVTDAGRSVLATCLPEHLELIEEWLTGPLERSGDLETFTRVLHALRDRLVPGATAGSTGDPVSGAGAPAGS